ncbi:uncharacterized protein L203_101144 [Cryptococcus depauperatus CBS 7841]|uniref:Uncharacterized protein n=1 Tax=Cryptococcus depauperatus CBS 7841 TaxID=1295531 RepID=A0AAJ8JPE7_9TREE
MSEADRANSLDTSSNTEPPSSLKRSTTEPAGNSNIMTIIDDRKSSDDTTLKVLLDGRSFEFKPTEYFWEFCRREATSNLPKTSENSTADAEAEKKA